MNGWMVRRMDGRIVGRMAKPKDGWKNGHTDQMNE